MTTWFLAPDSCASVSTLAERHLARNNGRAMWNRALCLRCVVIIWKLSCISSSLFDCSLFCKCILAMKGPAFGRYPGSCKIASALCLPACSLSACSNSKTAERILRNLVSARCSSYLNPFWVMTGKARVRFSAPKWLGVEYPAGELDVGIPWWGILQPFSTVRYRILMNAPRSF